MENHLLQIENAELWLLGAGLAVALITLAAVSARNAWGRVWRFPPIAPDRLEAFDIAAGLIALLILPAFIVQLSLYIAPAAEEMPATTPAISQPATAPATQSAEEPAAEFKLTPLQIAASAVGQLFAAALLLLIGGTRFENGLRGWGLDLRALPRRAAQALATYLGTRPLCFGVLYVTLFTMMWLDSSYAPEIHETIRILQSGEMPGWALAATAAGAIVFAPVYEECFFRGLLLPMIAKVSGSTWLAILISGLLFGVFHYGLPHTIPALTVFGIVLGYAYARTRSLTLVILLHAIFNAKTLLSLALSAPHSV